MLYQDITYNNFSGQSSKNAFYRHSDEIRTGYGKIKLITGFPKWFLDRIIRDKIRINWLSTQNVSHRRYTVVFQINLKFSGRHDELNEKENYGRSKIYMVSSDWGTCSGKIWLTHPEVKNNIIYTNNKLFWWKHRCGKLYINDYILNENYGRNLSSVFIFSSLYITQNKFDLKPSHAYFFYK